MMGFCIVLLIFYICLPCGISYERIVGVTANNTTKTTTSTTTTIATTYHDKDLASQIVSWEKQHANSPLPNGRELQFRDSSSSSSDRSCPSTEVDFRTTLFITQTGNLRNLEYGDVDYIGTLLEWRYNVKNKDFCDPLYRRIRQTRIVPSNTIEFYSGRNSQDVFRIRYDIEGYCFGCSTDGFPLFGGEESTESEEGTGTRRLEGFSSDDACECNSVNAQRRGPTEEELLNSVNGVIRNEQSNDIGNMVGITEVMSYACPDKRDFQSLLIIRIEGDLLSINEEEVEAIEGTLKDTYNELSFSFCAFPYFHTIKRARIIDIEVNYFALGVSSFLQFEVTGDCHGCAFDGDLFFRNVEPVEDADDGINEQEGSDLCFCPASAEKTGVFRAPTEGEFREKFSDNLLKLKKGNFLSAVEAVSASIEIDQVECSSEQEFTALVFTEVVGEPALVTDGELTAVGDTVLEIFNQGAFFGCDGYFRDTTGIKILLDEERIKQQNRRRAQGGGNNMLNPISSVPSVFEIVGSCRNCPLATASSIRGSFYLFDDSATRRSLSEDFLSFLSQSTISYRRVQAGDRCVCPVGIAPKLDGGLTKEELLLSVTDRIGVLNRNGIVDNVNRIGNSPRRVRCSERVTIRNDFFDVQYDITESRNALVRSEDVFQEFFVESYESQQNILCDPFRRQITSISCVPTEYTGSSGAMRCDVEFECYGPCDDWIIPQQPGSTSLFDSTSREYEIFNCPCLDATARAPSKEEVMDSLLSVDIAAASSSSSSFLSFRPELSTQTTPVEQSIRFVRFTMNFGNYFRIFRVSQEEYEGMQVQTAEFFFHHLRGFFDGSSSSSTLVYFIPSVHNVQVSRQNIRIDFEALVEFIGETTVPSSREIYLLMTQVSFSDFIYQFVRNAEPEDSIFHSTIVVSMSSS